MTTQNETAIGKTTGKMSIDTKEQELSITRTFAAPRALVFETFSDCKHLKHWWGPTGWTLPVCKMDFRVGGSWLYCMRGPNGEESWGKSVYQAIAAPERIVYTDYFVDAEGNAIDGMPELALTLTFVEVNGQTQVVSHAQLASAAALQSLLDMGMLEGLTQTWDRLEAYLAAV